MGRPGRRPTIVDIARSAEVSISTVSRVLNDQPVADHALVKRVRQAALDLGYRPNLAARELRRGVTSSVGVVVPDLANPFFPHLLKGLATDASAGEHRLVVVDSCEDPTQELRLVRQLAGTSDGIILCSPRMPAPDLQAVAALDLPVLVTNRAVGDLPFGSVGIDSAVGMHEAVSHLYELGHRHVGYLAGPESSWSEGLRRAGLEDAAAAHGMAVSVATAGSTSDDGFESLPALLAEGVSAVLAFNDLVAVGALSRLRELDVQVPRDLSVVGFDDLPVSAFLGPPLTTVNVPKEELGRRAWAMLRSQLADGEVAPEERLPSALVVRRSTAAPAAR